MKTDKKSIAPASPGSREKPAAQDAREPDHFKERQKLPPLRGMIGVAKLGLQTPLGELEFGNFYHL